MIEESATIISIDAEKIVLQAERQSSCGSCGANKACGTATIAKVVGQRRSLITLDVRPGDTESLKPGDQVMLGMDENTLLSTSAIAYLLPLGGFFVAALLMQQFGTVLGMQGEGYVIIAALLGLFTGVQLVRRLIRRSSGVQIRPVILRKIQQVPAGHGNIQQP